MTGLPQVSLSFSPQSSESTLDEIFSYIAQSKRRCYIAFDEFQQVLEYPEKNVEALLRTHIQTMSNARFIFSGSRLHMMMEMFNSPKHPFYRSTEKLSLHTLDEAVYFAFAEDKLKKRQKSPKQQKPTLRKRLQRRRLSFRNRMWRTRSSQNMTRHSMKTKLMLQTITIS